MRETPTAETLQALERIEAKAAFKGFAAVWGVGVIEGILIAGAQNRTRGLQGATVPSDDGTSWITVDETVSFRIDDYGPHILPLEEAIEALEEVRAEAIAKQS